MNSDIKILEKSKKNINYYEYKDILNKYQEVNMPGGIVTSRGIDEVTNFVCSIYNKETRTLTDPLFASIEGLNVKTFFIEKKIDNLKTLKAIANNQKKLMDLKRMKNEFYDQIDKIQRKSDQSKKNVLADIDWVWKVSKGGTLTKRIAKRLYKESQIKLSPSELSDLGNRISSNTLEEELLHLKIVPITDNTLPWDAGDFNDQDSCFFGCRSHIANLFTDYKFSVIFVENRDTQFFSRAIFYRISKDKYLIFNGYGKQLYEQARIIAFAMGLSYRKISCRNEGYDNDELLWINGHNAFVIGKEEKIGDMSEYCFDIDETQYEQNRHCDGCGEILDDYFTTPNDETYCTNCFDYHCRIDYQGNTIWESDAIWCEEEDCYCHCDEAVGYRRDDGITEYYTSDYYNENKEIIEGKNNE